MLFLDPVCVISISWFFAFFFGESCISKIIYKEYAIEAISGYELLPPSLINVFLLMQVTFEGGVFISLFLFPFSDMPKIMAVFLIGVYSIAIFINLLRGKKEVDCGCYGPYRKEVIHWSLLLRNSLFIFFLSLGVIDPSERMLSFLDWIVCALTALSLILLFKLSGALKNNYLQLYAIENRRGTWKQFL